MFLLTLARGHIWNQSIVIDELFYRPQERKEEKIRLILPLRMTLKFRPLSFFPSLFNPCVGEVIPRWFEELPVPKSPTCRNLTEFLLSTMSTPSVTKTLTFARVEHVQMFTILCNFVWWWRNMSPSTWRGKLSLLLILVISVVLFLFIAVIILLGILCRFYIITKNIVLTYTHTHLHRFLNTRQHVTRALSISVSYTVVSSVVSARTVTGLLLPHEPMHLF